MRLLRTKDLRFEEYFGKPTPPYAILSHTWYPDHEEVTYREMCVGKGTKKLGYDKVRKCGQIAAGNGLKYFWVDTCCIDKSNNVELTESIRSMFEWYRKARVCYAYLSDVSALSFRPTVSCFKAIKWFTRGWTLQEFLAPADVQFISKEWKYLGSKAGNLTRVIEEFTGIPKAVLEGVALTMFSVAERMSWAVGRRTTRVEDIAYSLMGIFDVDIPPLYGEKGNAFIRLQEEIMRRTDDQSIFAWKEPDPSFPKKLMVDYPRHPPPAYGSRET
ncbi:HET-domain-containing protein [Eremomyces bilateralis CBS 781.70]|uniref:HET-domain-containing protein n=1 Tax=Eremomyces bilateralis CBS 781.70 TaxID=1392243 RepID=A0A6G1GET0_9PEZI|nr:HET-domain-containing protein [Eremomyces bilateralis CBS 781.70]KAF1816568.1 HET-domain-containing protein [Eremomyces bilateralis CBS 781.70]